MILPVTLETLRDLRLTNDEWNTLFHAGEWKAERDHVDMLVLAGLAVWTDDGEDWNLTEAGHAACNVIDLIFDWDTFAFSDLSSKKIKKD